MLNMLNAKVIKFFENKKIFFAFFCVQNFDYIYVKFYKGFT